jgi:hypothetical protein
MKHGIANLALLNLLLLGSSLVIAEEQVAVAPTSSGRLYADYTFQDCCTLDAWSSSSGALWTETCESMGGYCMGGKDVANWVFEMPDMPVGATVLDARIQLNKQSGVAGSAVLYLRQTSSSALGISSALLTYNSPMHTQSAYFSNGMSHSFGLPTSFFQDPNQSHVAMALYRSSTLQIYNAGTLKPTLVVTYEGGEPPCVGDLDGDGVVGGTDLAGILGYWGSDNPTFDLDQSGTVDGADLTIILARWGLCS